MKTFFLKFALIGALGFVEPAGAATDCCPSSPPSSDGVFKLVKTKGRVSLYERWVEVEPGNKVRELKAEFTVDAGMDAALALLKDKSRVHRWMQGMQEFQVVENLSDGWVSYVRYSIPWPLADQDIVMRFKLFKSTGLYTASFQSSTHASYPVKDGVTRMKGVTGSWQFQAKGSNQTQVTYLIMTRNKSNFPKWMTDPIIQDNMLDTMNAFAGQARELHVQR
ncbi:MAG: START domain-containing protein [Saprospiraceae bacterium]